MKTLLTTLVLVLCLLQNSYGQKLTLSDLTNLCSKQNWEDVNQILMNKGWTFYDSEKGSSTKYSTITWSFEKDYYSDKASGWLYLYTYEGFPNKISYSVFNQDSYALVQNSLTSSGFKLQNSEIEDNQVVSYYGSKTYTLTISTEKRQDSDYDERSLTAYRITIIKKAGIYDPDNGKKTDYYYGDVAKAEYTLSNGEINGQLKVYHLNGKLKKVGSYTNGKENGLFKEYDDNGNLEAEYSISNGELNGSLKTYYSNGKLKKSGNYLKGEEHGNFVEYDESGNKEAEYTMANGMKNGVLKIYEEGKIDVSTTFKDDIKNGQREEYYYDDETGKLQLKQIGEYLNDEKIGTWKLLFIEEDNTERLITFENYLKGVKNGQFQDISGDSLIIGTYRNDELHGEYKVYLDVSRMLFGGVMRTDTSNLTLLVEGNYYDGLESGYWKNYDMFETLRSEGRYSGGQETGEWKHYYTNYTDGKGNNLPFSKELFLVENYSNGELNGKSIRYSYLDKVDIPCSELDENMNPLDTCQRTVQKKVFETSYYKSDKLHGPFELRDSSNNLITKGNFIDDLKDGEWIRRYEDENWDGSPYIYFEKGDYKNDKRNGRWVQYQTENKIDASYTYKNGELHGDYIEWNGLGNPREKKIFISGKFKELIIFDSLGITPRTRYEIFEEYYDSYKCRKTDYLDKGSQSQEFTLIKNSKTEGRGYEDIDHDWFALSFAFATGKNSDGKKGYKDGVFKLTNSEDDILIEGKYYKQNKIGLWTYFFYDQGIVIKSNFNDDKKIDEKYYTLNGLEFSGEFYSIDEEENTKEIRKIKNGLRNGSTIFIDLNTNKTIRKESYKNGLLK